MYTEFDIYATFRKIQAEQKNRPYKLPKDWNRHFQNMSKANKENLSKMKDYMNTKWKNIDLEKYFRCGFELYKNFTYAKFFDQKIINLYISRDKTEKRDNELSKRSIIFSAKFVKKYMKENNINSLKKYAWMKNGFQHICVNHYIRNQIDEYFLVYLIMKKYCILEDEEKTKIPYVIDNFRKLKHKLNKIKPFLHKIEEDLNMLKGCQKNDDRQLIMTESPSGQMLYGDQTDQERKDEQKQYNDQMLNEEKE
jgi:hypothetical protein